MPAHLVKIPYERDDDVALVEAIGSLEAAGERVLSVTYFALAPTASFVIVTEGRGKVERRTRSDAT